MIEPTSRHVKAARDVIMRHEYGSANPSWMIDPAPWVGPLAEQIARAVLNVEPEAAPVPTGDDGEILFVRGEVVGVVDRITKQVMHPRPPHRRTRWNRFWDVVCELVRELAR